MDNRNPFDYQNPLYSDSEVFFRHPEYEVLHGAISSADVDSRANVVVFGRPKIGKSSFVNGSIKGLLNDCFVPVVLTIEALGPNPSASIVTQFFDAVLETLLSYEVINKSDSIYQNWKAQTVLAQVNSELEGLSLESGLKCAAQLVDTEIGIEFDTNLLRRDWERLETLAIDFFEKFSGFALILDEITNLSNVDLKTQDLIARLLNARSGGVVIAVVQERSLEDVAGIALKLNPAPINIKIGPFSDASNEFGRYAAILGWYKSEYFPKMRADLVGSVNNAFCVPLMFGLPWRFKLITHYLFEDFRKTGQFILRPQSMQKIIDTITSTDEGIEKSVKQKRENLLAMKNQIDIWLNKYPDKIAYLDEIVTSSHWTFLPAIENTKDAGVGEGNYGKNLKEMSVILNFPSTLNSKEFNEDLDVRRSVALSLWEEEIIGLLSSEMKRIKEDEVETEILTGSCRPYVDFDPILWLYIRLQYLEHINGPIEKTLTASGKLEMPESSFIERSTYLSSLVRTSARRVVFDLSGEFDSDGREEMYLTTYSPLQIENIFHERTEVLPPLLESIISRDFVGVFQSWSLHDLSNKNSEFFDLFDKSDSHLWLWQISLRHWPEKIDYRFLLKHSKAIDPNDVLSFYREHLESALKFAFENLDIEVLLFSFDLIDESIAEEIGFICSRDININNIENLFRSGEDSLKLIDLVLKTAERELIYSDLFRLDHYYNIQMKERFVWYGQWLSALGQLDKGRHYLRIASTAGWPSVFYLNHATAVTSGYLRDWQMAIRYIDGAVEYMKRNPEHRSWLFITYSPLQESWNQKNTRLNEDLDVLRIARLERACFILMRELEKESCSTFFGKELSKDTLAEIEKDLGQDFYLFLEESRKDLEIWGQDTLAGCYFLLGNFKTSAEVLREMTSAEKFLGPEKIRMAQLDLEQVLREASEMGVAID